MQDVACYSYAVETPAGDVLVRGRDSHTVVAKDYYLKPAAQLLVSVSPVTFVFDSLILFCLVLFHFQPVFS